MSEIITRIFNDPTDPENESFLLSFCIENRIVAQIPVNKADLEDIALTIAHKLEG